MQRKEAWLPRFSREYEMMTNFPGSNRNLSMAPFLGPVLGPIVGGFAGKSYLGWRSVFYIMTVFAGVMYIAGIVFLPESYAPILVRRRAQQLQAASTSEGGPLVHFKSKYDINRKTTKEILKVSLTRPFVILFLEPIVLLLSIYVAVRPLTTLDPSYIH